MNNKEFTSELADRLGYTIKDTSELISSLLSDMTQELEDGMRLQYRALVLLK